MSDVVIVAVLSLIGTLVGSLGGIVVSNKLVNYRLKELEDKVHKHNNLVERLYKAEGQLKELENTVYNYKGK